MYLLYSAKRSLFIAALALLGTAYAAGFGNVSILYAETAPAPETVAEESAAPAAAPEGQSTEPTGAGTDAEDAPATSEGTANTPATVTTGDAESTGSVESDVNKNDVTTEGGTEVVIENENTAETDTDLEVGADTGANTAAGSAGASVATGNAVASGNVVNVVNTNIVNANGLLYFLDVLFGNVQLDMRELFSLFTGREPASPCSLTNCGGDTTVSITNQNSASVVNNVSVGAATGGNSADGGTGSGSVTTGDAYASANVVNLVNTNIVDSNYLLLSINNFGSLMHDIVFPGADFFRDIFASNQGLSEGSSLSVQNTNDASVETNVDVTADTGGNTASGTDSSIATGNAHAGGTIINQVNQNLLGDSLMFLFRIHGSWTGDVFGLPEGMAWRQTDDGVELMFAPGGGTDSARTGSTTIQNTNTATVTNNISVFALTGDNMAAGSESSVDTGDAYASANVVNVVNTNVIGRNWVLAVFNIFGDFDGNIAFGQPDLWVGARAVVPSSVRAGECYTYEVTVNNFGDSAASNVRLSSIFEKTRQVFSTFDAEQDGRVSWDLGRIRAGGTRQISIPVCLGNLVRGGDTIDTGFVVDARETDANDLDNSEEISFVAAGSGGGSVLRLGDADLTVKKVASRESITASSSVVYQITIENTGDPVYNALLVDTIYNESGVAINEQRWGLDTIQAGETIIVSYEAFFESSTTPGVYTNEAFVSGTEHHPDYKHNYGSPIDSPVATVDVRVIDTTKQPEVSATVCEPLLTTYIRRGADNVPSEVSRLQFFLKTHEEDMSVPLSGVYDESTETSVHAFQEKYRDDILTPWGVSQTTGYVYYTTQKKINELWCNRDFPLSTDQEREIASFKQRALRYEAAGVAMPEERFREIGMTDTAETTSALAAATQAEDENTEHREPVMSQLASAENAGNAAAAILSQVRSSVYSAFSWLGF